MMQISCQFEIRLAQKIAEFYVRDLVCQRFNVVLMKNEVSRGAFLSKMIQNLKKPFHFRLLDDPYDSMKN
jgi:hypothetical protein